MNGYWIFLSCIYALVAASKMRFEHRRGSGRIVKIACIFWLPVLIVALFITICQHVLEERLR